MRRVWPNPAGDVQRDQVLQMQEGLLLLLGMSTESMEGAQGLVLTNCGRQQSVANIVRLQVGNFVEEEACSWIEGKVL